LPQDVQEGRLTLELVRSFEVSGLQSLAVL
jgi:hypothetical protein